MTAEEIKELIREEILDNLEIRVSCEDNCVDVSIYYDNEFVSNEYSYLKTLHISSN